MRGFPSIAKNRNIASSIARSDQFRLLLISVLVGASCSVFVIHVRLHLGLPGHKALFWMIPVLLTRLLSRFKAGMSVGGMSAATATFIGGGNLAGGLYGLPLVLVACVMLDVVVHLLQKHRPGWVLFIVTLSLMGMLANSICFAKRLFLPVGISPHFAFSTSSLWYQLASYALFGLLSGLIAACSYCAIERHRSKKQ